MRSYACHNEEYADFTEARYRAYLRQAKATYRFVRYGEQVEERSILWRHDLDTSMQRALRLAQIEKEEDVVATHFLFPRCLYYNLLNPVIKQIVHEIISLGHDIGLHFDPTSLPHGSSRADFEAAVGLERDLLEREFGARPTAVSFHLYGVLTEPVPDDPLIAGLVNAYSAQLRASHGYVSDSNGIWLHRRLPEVLDAASENHLQVLTHPEWWTEDVHPPRRRLQQAIDDQAKLMAVWYDDIVARSGRPNLW